MTRAFRSNAVIAFIVGIALALGSVVGAAPVSAAQCKGGNSHRVAAVDPVTGGATELIDIDSCKAKKLTDAYAKVKDAAGLAGALGGAWWPVGAVSGVLYAWAWGNQSAMKKCAKPGTGVRYKQFNGIVLSCFAQ